VAHRDPASAAERCRRWIRRLAAVDARLAASMERLVEIRDAHFRGEPPRKRRRRGAAAKPREDPFAALCLDFSLPGRPDVRLRAPPCSHVESDRISNFEAAPTSRPSTVTAANALAYVEAVCARILRDGVAAQVAAIRGGLADMGLGAATRGVFSAEELELVALGADGGGRPWTPRLLAEAVRCDHGYDRGSGALKRLFAILSELDAADRRRFLQFTTGSPRLPVGGLGQLRPRLTVVQRTPPAGARADDCLPSASTCVHCLKLPDYSGTDVMRAKLLLAIREGGTAFYLS
jgi:E3 ubiquitin-protein ligase TRIP12